MILGDKNTKYLLMNVLDKYFGNQVYPQVLKGDYDNIVANFFETGLWIKYKTSQYATSFTERKINTSVISNYARDSFTILTWDAVYPANNRPCLVYAL